MADRQAQAEADVLSQVADALLQQILILGHVHDASADNSWQTTLQRAKVLRAKLLHDVAAQMWRSGVPAIDQATSVSAERKQELHALVGGDGPGAISALGLGQARVENVLARAIADERLGDHLQNFLQTVRSRLEGPDVMAGQATTAVASATSSHTLADHALHVLLVEDDPQVAIVMEEMLVHLGWRVTRTLDAETALATLNSEIDLLFSDVRMPGSMDGLQLARSARASRPDLPIVLSSGYAERVRKAAQDLGIPLLPKPFSLGDLAAALEAARPVRG